MASNPVEAKLKEVERLLKLDQYWEIHLLPRAKELAFLVPGLKVDLLYRGFIGHELDRGSTGDDCGDIDFMGQLTFHKKSSTFRANDLSPASRLLEGYFLLKVCGNNLWENDHSTLGFYSFGDDFAHSWEDPPGH